MFLADLGLANHVQWLAYTYIMHLYMYMFTATICTYIMNSIYWSTRQLWILCIILISGFCKTYIIAMHDVHDRKHISNMEVSILDVNCTCPQRETSCLCLPYTINAGICSVCSRTLVEFLECENSFSFLSSPLVVWMCVDVWCALACITR